MHLQKCTSATSTSTILGGGESGRRKWAAKVGDVKWMEKAGKGADVCNCHKWHWRRQTLIGTRPAIQQAPKNISLENLAQMFSLSPSTSPKKKKKKK